MDEHTSRDKVSIGPTHASADKTSITCSNMPESLFDAAVAKRHFGKFGRVTKILLRPKKQACVIDYDSNVAAQKALLNAGAYDGFMFDVTWTKRKKKRARKEEDPDWVPDSDVEEELSAMGAVPVYRPPRQQPMQQNQPPLQTVGRKIYSARPSVARDRPTTTLSQQPSSDPPGIVSIPTSMSTAEAAAELRQLRLRVSRTPEEQRRTLDIRDRVLRAWGGTGARVRVGGATIGTCPDMCPEKERLQRQAEHQVMVLELEAGRDGSAMAERRAVKQYSRSSADQETPMCYELRPPATLAMTMAYLLREVADCSLTQVSLADWFHFMWDRCRGIRKDITQQALCCAESVRLVEQCARFHAHCAARLADLEHSAFDPRLNTDNLTKCLQSLKHMYADLRADSKPCEAEFRSYIALLNLGDANFCWEIKQLPQEIQKSAAIMFTVEIFMALDNNNYVRFFRLIRDKATYLQACILLRYFNDVRARGLARIVKAFAPRGGSKYPVKDLMENLAFEDIDSLKSFISHYGLKLSRHDDEDLSVILDRNQFIEDSDPYPISRAVKLIESKRNCSVGEIIAGAKLTENTSYMNHSIHSSFNDNGTLKTSAILAEDQGYGTRNESNKNLNALRHELDKTPQPEVTFGNSQTILKANEHRNNVFKPEAKSLATKQKNFPATAKDIKDLNTPSKIFSFKPAIAVVSPEIIKSSPAKLFTQGSTTTYSFSNPDFSETSTLWNVDKSNDEFQPAKINKEATFPKSNLTNIFFNQSNKTKSEHVNDTFSAQSQETSTGNIFGKPQQPSTVFGSGKTIPINLFKQPANQTAFNSEIMQAKDLQNSNVFQTPAVFGNMDERDKVFFKAIEKPQHLFGEEVNSISLFHKPENLIGQEKTDGSSIFGTARQPENEKFAAIPGPNIFAQGPPQKNIFGQEPVNIFKPINSTPQPVFGQEIPTGNLFTQVDTNANKSDPRSVFGGSSNKLSSEVLIPQFKSQSPKSLFHTPFTSTTFGDSRVLNAAFGPLTQQPVVSEPSVSVENQLIEQRGQEELKRKELEEKLRNEEAQKIEKQRRHEETRRQQIRQEEEIRKLQEEKRKQEELRQKILEEKKQADLKRIAEEARRAENEKKKAEERHRLLKQIDKESQDLVDELTLTINKETVVKLVSEELEEIKKIIQLANIITDEILQEITNDVCLSETKAEKFLSEKLMAKFSYIWRVYTARNIKRRMIVKETPIWLANKSPLQAANHLKRQALPSVLVQMNAFHRGYRFSGKTKHEQKLQPYNVMEVVRSSLLKGLRRVNLQYHECFFWKVTLSSPGENQWLNKRVKVHDWLLQMFSDKDCNSEYDGSIVYLKKHSWNNLMHFAISITFAEGQNKKYLMDGSNGIIFFTTEDDKDLLIRIKDQMQDKVSRHVLPLAIVTPNNDTIDIEKFLIQLLNENIISNYKIFKVVKDNSFKSIDNCTKSALRWLAKNIPDVPPLEMDTLTSILFQFIGTEFWFRLKLERQTRMKEIFKDLHKLIALYNLALEKLANLITDPSVFAYPIFPAELKMFLVDSPLLPKSYEFFPNNWINFESINDIKEALNQMYLPQPESSIHPQNYTHLHAQIHEFCNNLDCFENPTEVACKIISYLPQELSNPDLSTAEFVQLFECYDFLDILNVIVIEKIKNTSIIKEKMVVYDKSALYNYRKWQWLHEIELLSAVKHKAVDFTLDEIDIALNESFVNSAKRIKLNDSDNQLTLEDNDETLVEESISNCDTEIVRYNTINATVNDIEKRLAEESLKASNLEELLRSALLD